MARMVIKVAKKSVSEKSFHWDQNLVSLINFGVTFIFVTYSAPWNEKAENLFDIQIQHDDW